MPQFHSNHDTPNNRQREEAKRYLRRNSPTYHRVGDKVDEQLMEAAKEYAMACQDERDAEMEMLIDRYLRILEVVGDGQVTVMLLQIEQHNLAMAEIIGELKEMSV